MIRGTLISVVITIGVSRAQTRVFLPKVLFIYDAAKS